jgi:hypothetical protein
MKLIALTLALFSFNAFSQGGSYDAAGNVKVQNKEYISVVNSTSATSLTNGMVVCFDVSDDNGIGVDLCGTAGFKAAGVVVGTCAVGARCKLQTKGYFSNLLFKYVSTTNSVAGGVLYATTDGKAYAATAAAALNPIAIALDASASADGELEAILDF